MPFIKNCQLLVTSSIILCFSTLSLAGDTAKEGAIDFSFNGTGQGSVLPASNDTMQINYETSGLAGAPDQAGPNQLGGMHCIGAVTVMGGTFDNESGLCTVSYADGSKTVTHYSGAGTLGATATGDWTYLGGTGQFEGITGGGTWSRISGPPPGEGILVSRTSITGTYTLP
ncbi:hypothetical protein ACFORG_02410 [Lutimaribacter marinistellae]|uniref:Uncharacterized protein n=1 Tax=Lutimaribacter marinistellae TaxID=1820329 RepID=A0ABV7TAG9_9RHOB